ncbi:MAG TPA: cupin domain-containing protein [Candidatus Binatia bacterium]|nr:cupin domain-containing protein [Candidatus Binatia bacterium]
MGTTVFRTSIKDIVDIQLVEDGINRLSWRDFGNGLSMARLAKEGKRELVLYRIAGDADPDAFVKHEHLGGEFYLVLKGRIDDESGRFDKGDVVYLDAHSVHTPRAIGDTLVLVLWPEGVRLVSEEKAQ